jgi:hypothetical protein
MSVLAMPTTPAIRKARFVLQASTTDLLSPLTRTVQTIERLGTRWLATYTLPPMSQIEAQTWCVWMARLNGRSGRFYGGDPAASTPRGSNLGSPKVTVANQVGTVLATYGWTGSQNGLLLPGDYMAWDTPSGWRELHKVRANVNSAAGGTATVLLSPPIRESPAADAVLIRTGATCVMALATDDEASWSVDEALIHEIVFNAEEMFSPTM